MLSSWLLLLLGLLGFCAAPAEAKASDETVQVLLDVGRLAEADWIGGSSTYDKRSVAMAGSVPEIVSSDAIYIRVNAGTTEQDIQLGIAHGIHAQAASLTVS